MTPKVKASYIEHGSSAMAGLVKELHVVSSNSLLLMLEQELSLLPLNRLYFTLQLPRSPFAPVLCSLEPAALLLACLHISLCCVESFLSLLARSLDGAQ